MSEKLQEKYYAHYKTTPHTIACAGRRRLSEIKLILLECKQFLIRHIVNRFVTGLYRDRVSNLELLPWLSPMDPIQHEEIHYESGSNWDDYDAHANELTQSRLHNPTDRFILRCFIMPNAIPKFLE
ncbi:MAG: hypothetical protein QF442_01405 [Candidatus Peribacteraceae bacterium]|nr:hypothetical protein [Candidatus Peribacteraceae bacterium]